MINVCYKTQRNRSGFSLIELLIVVAIIALLASVVLFSVSESRRKARNAAVMSQMLEYRKAVELYRSDVGEYPGTNAGRNNIYCLGDGLSSGDRCLQIARVYATPHAAVGTSFSTYMGSLPRFSQPVGGFNYSSPAYSGCTGAGLTNTSCTPADYSIWFVLEGTNENCGDAAEVDVAYEGVYTLCRLQPR